jgi:hypothetical protein
MFAKLNGAKNVVAFFKGESQSGFGRVAFA